MKRVLLIFLLASSAVADPTVTSIEPSFAPASGGVFVHIYGSDLIGFALACPTIECGNYVKFGDELGGIAVNTFDEIVVLAPAHAAGTVDLTVNVAGKKKIVLPAAFTYEALDTTAMERVLLPLVLFGNSTTPGAFGSMWKAEVTFHNASSDDVPIVAPNCNPLILAPCPPPPVLQGGSTLIEPLYGFPGAFVFIPRQHVNDVDVSLRIQDVSRQSQTWGTSIPIVRATQFKPAVHVIGVPADSRFRLTLRIYGYSQPGPVRVRVFDPASATPFADVTLNLQGRDPAYLQLDPLTLPTIAPPPLIRIEVSSAIDPPQPVWAFVSVTNNETQHVTVIAPSP